MNLHPVGTIKLTHLEASQFIDSQLTEIRSMGDEEIFIDDAMNDYLVKLDTCLGTFNNAIMIVRKNKETIKIEAQDNQRDEALNFLQKGAAVFEISDIEAERDASRNLKALFSTYKNLANLNYAAETAGIDNLLSDLGNSEYEPMVELLGLERYASRLRQSNNAFKELFSGRNQETAQKETFDSKLLKKEMLAVYNDFASYILVRAKVEASPALFTNTLNLLNASRKYYSDMLARRNGKAVPVEAV